MKWKFTSLKGSKTRHDKILRNLEEEELLSRFSGEVAWFSDGPGRSRLSSHTYSFPRPMALVQSRVHDVIAPGEFHPMRANVTLPQKWGMRGMWLCKQIQIRYGGKCGRQHRESLPRFRLFPEQEKELKAFIDKNVVLLNLPIGKSLVFQMAPLVHAELIAWDDGFAANPILVVISP